MHLPGYLVKLCTLSARVSLQKDGTREYGNFGVAHLGLGNDFSAKFIIQYLLYLGGTRSAEDLAVFTRTTSERLCLGCGLLADEAFCPIPPRDRSGFFKATIRLRHLVLSHTVPQGLTAEQEALKALMPLAHNRTGSRWFRFFRDLAGDVAVRSMSPMFVVTFTWQVINYIQSFWTGDALWHDLRFCGMFLRGAQANG